MYIDAMKPYKNKKQGNERGIQEDGYLELEEANG